jgi:hypothetical protein
MCKKEYLKMCKVMKKWGIGMQKKKVLGGQGESTVLRSQEHR